MNPPKLYLFALVILLSVTYDSLAEATESGIVFTVASATPGDQLVRTSLPVPQGLLLEGQSFSISDGKKEFSVAVRPLSWHRITNSEPKSVRRALVTFPYSFPNEEKVTFSLRCIAAEKLATSLVPVTVLVQDEHLSLTWKNGDRVDLHLIAPSRTSADPPRVEIVEDNSAYRWQRWHFPDLHWPRIIEVRSDALGSVVLVAHLQHQAAEDGRAPDFGWEAKGKASFVNGMSSNKPVTLKEEPFRHDFAVGDLARFVLGRDGLAIYHPAAPLKRRGHVAISFPGSGQLNYRYLRCTAEERVPMQPTSWQRAEIVIAPSHLAPLSATLESPHQVVVPSEWWQELYGVENTSMVGIPHELDALVKFHRDAIVRSMSVGDDWGNVTGYVDTKPHGEVFGMNRLNHCAAIFADGWRSGDRRLLETGVLWCDNFYDQSIWWGKKEYGGTRYNNAARENRTPPDKEYMWRSNASVSFCAKGYDAFWLAWEQTGDPRMREALDAQVAYASLHVHADRRGCRNIGDVRDFMRLYRYTGEQRYLDRSLRLFRELRTVLSTGDLFDEGGKPIEPNPPFIELDKYGPPVGFAKPYIIGYALAGLPELSPHARKEPKLVDVVRAVADFLVDSQDPAGGWRYPHPRSSSMIESIEHAWQIAQAARLLGPEEKWLDAIETSLRPRIHGWQRTGTIFRSLNGWEITTGKVKDSRELCELYKKPSDRDASRDYSEGRANFGTASPGGLVYFTDVLSYYLQHRPASRLLAEPKAESPLGQVLARVPDSIPKVK